MRVNVDLGDELGDPPAQFQTASMDVFSRCGLANQHAGSTRLMGMCMGKVATQVINIS